MPSMEDTSKPVDEDDVSLKSWSNVNVTPADAEVEEEEWDFVLPRSKTHVTPDFSTLEEDRCPTPDREASPVAVPGAEPDTSASKADEDGCPTPDHDEASLAPCAESDAGASKAADPIDAASRSTVTHDSKAAPPMATAEPDACALKAADPDDGAPRSLDVYSVYDDLPGLEYYQVPADDEVYFTKAHALKAVRADFAATPGPQVHELKEAEQWIHSYYRGLGKKLFCLKAEVLENRDHQYTEKQHVSNTQLVVICFLRRQLTQLVHSAKRGDVRDKMGIGRSAAYRHVFRPSNPQIVKLLRDISELATFTSKPEAPAFGTFSASVETASQTQMEEEDDETQIYRLMKRIRSTDKLKTVLKNIDEKLGNDIAAKAALLQELADNVEEATRTLENVQREKESLDQEKEQLKLEKQKLKLEKGYYWNKRELIKREIDEFGVRGIEAGCQPSPSGSSPSLLQLHVHSMIQATQYRATEDFSKMLDDKFAENAKETRTLIKSLQGRVPEAGSALPKRGVKSGPAAPPTRKPVVRERADPTPGRATTLKTAGAGPASSARTKPGGAKIQKSSADRGLWLQSGSSH